MNGFLAFLQVELGVLSHFSHVLLMVREFRVDEVSAGQGPISIKWLAFGGRKVMDPVQDQGGLLLVETFLVIKLAIQCPRLASEKKIPHTLLAMSVPDCPSAFFPFQEGFFRSDFV